MKSATLALQRAKDSFLNVVCAGNDNRVRPSRKHVAEQELPVFVQMLYHDGYALME